MREFEQLVQDSRLRILDRGRRSQEKCDGSGSGWERLCRGAGHGYNTDHESRAVLLERVMRCLHKPMVQFGGLTNLVVGSSATHWLSLSSPLPNSHGSHSGLTRTPIMFSVRSALANIPRASRLTARPVVARAYHEKVISHYEQPRNVRCGSQPRPLQSVFKFPRLSDNHLAGGLAPQNRHRRRNRARRCTCVCDALPPHSFFPVGLRF